MLDRRSIISRHDVVVNHVDKLGSLSVGNGEFAVTVDVTGLQTFPEFYQETGVPLGTQSQWGWHTAPNPENYALADAVQWYNAHGHRVPYCGAVGEYETGVDPARAEAAVRWLRHNPHRLHLGLISLQLTHRDGTRATIDQIHDIQQRLSLWEGVITTEFTFDNARVKVITLVHPQLDQVSVRIESSLVQLGRLRLDIEFPDPSSGWRGGLSFEDVPHETDELLTRHAALITRTLDDDSYHVITRWTDGLFRRVGPHQFEILGTLPVLECSMLFYRGHADHFATTFAEAQAACKAHWEQFWSTGGAIDLSHSTDLRAAELERRVVLSQYLMAIQCCGSNPPQETGLTYNSWHGKFHLEMTWWHIAHFALWGRAPLMHRTMQWYRRTAQKARENAEKQGYRGLRWGKMLGPDGRESPSDVGVFLIWQQPHLIYLAELLHSTGHAHDALEEFGDLVLETAEFMASYAHWDGERFVLGPPLIPAQESYGSIRTRVINPTYELAYWYWGLKQANIWRERLGMSRVIEWDHIADHLAKPTVRGGIYAAIEPEPYTIRTDHPSMLQALGWLPPTPMIDRQVMNATLDDVQKNWAWDSTWGWDYPVVAMTAARLGRWDDAFDALLTDTPKNRYLANGHNWQSDRLTIYLPGNGGLLYAIAMLAQLRVKSERWVILSEGLLPGV